MTVALYIVAILGLAVLMVVHEGGHYLAARKFGMRVVKFSIGFGPTLWKHRPKDSPTTYQVAIIPFLAYVQIAGMNPYEENDPKDPGSYMNASLWARTVTIAAGPLTNYFFASILFFFGFLLAGNAIATMPVNEVMPGGPAASADVRPGDVILQVNGKGINSWEELRTEISSHPGEKVDLFIDRNGEKLHKEITPGAKGSKDAGRIQIVPTTKRIPMGIGEAAKRAVIEPPMVVYNSAKGIVNWIRGREKGELAGPVGIVKETARQAEDGAGSLLIFLGALSAYLGAFNLLPFPALDGGRLLFLAIEAISRRRPDAKLEAKVHALGLLMLLGIIAFVTYTELVPK
jgi:regulator of sigma E protease